jgi:hypothetical protein
MRPEDQLLYACTRLELQAEHRERVQALCAPSGLDWEAVFSTAEQHGVAPLVGANLEQSGAALPDSVCDRFEDALVRNTLAKGAIARNTAELLAYLRHQHIEVMLIKGAALDLLVYDPHPARCARCDADRARTIHPHPARCARRPLPAGEAISSPLPLGEGQGEGVP